MSPDLQEVRRQLFSALYQRTAALCTTNEGPLTNPLVDKTQPASFATLHRLALPGTSTTARGERIVRLPPTVSLSRSTHDPILDGNQAFRHEPGTTPGTCFYTFLNPPSAEMLLELARKGASGFMLTTHKGLPPIAMLQLGSPQAYAEATVFACLNSRRTPQDLCSAELPFRSVTGAKPLVPLIGDLWCNGRKLTGAELDRLGITPMLAHDKRTPEDSPPLMKIPCFLQGGRSINFPLYSPLHFMPTTTRGMRLATNDEVQHRAEGLIEVPTAGFTITGVGIRRYLTHAVNANTDLSLRTDEITVLAEKDLLPETIRLKQREPYAGGSGIFLDVRYQPDIASPCGGLSGGQLDLDRDTELLAHGARLSTLVVAMTTLFTKAELEAAVGEPCDLPGETVDVTTRAILDTSVRLSLFSPTGTLNLTGTDLRTQRTMLRRHVQTAYARGEAVETTHYAMLLNEFCGNLGINLRVCLNLRYTICLDQDSASNISIRGNIADTGNFRRFSPLMPFAAVAIIARWTTDCFSLATRCSISQKDFLNHPTFKTFVTEAFPTFSEQRFNDMRAQANRIEDSEMRLHFVRIHLLKHYCEERLGAALVWPSTPQLLAFFTDHEFLRGYLYHCISTNMEAYLGIKTGTLECPIDIQYLFSSEFKCENKEQVTRGALIEGLLFAFSEYFSPELASLGHPNEHRAMLTEIYNRCVDAAKTTLFERGSHT